ncbi:MAG: ABC transporter ATP-binding protein [Sphaerochaetaceae bacterium]|nr:ABC transporter ATP-binding protein [Sphaerochaetaceae bacterium]
MPEIRLEHVTKRFEKFVAVDDLNLVINEHDFITLLGPSGCGKTTTLRMIAGLETPTEGKITIGDKVVFDAATGVNVSPAKRDIGFLFQNYALWPHMTVYQNIAFGLENLKWKKEDIKVRVQEMLKMLKIEEFVGRYPAELSGGQQQRVAIARTLAPKPQVLFMDEPLSNLDAKLRSEMRTELKRLHSDSNSTFVYVTHDQLEAMTLATKICLMEKGVLQQYDPPLTVYSQPANRFVADFVGNPTMNFIDARVTDSSTMEFLGVKARFTPNDPKQTIKASEVTLGIRPEFFTIKEGGKIKATAYSTLPSGMETTVKVRLAYELISSVVFGAIDYRVDQPIECDIIGDQVCIFDKETTKRVSIGKLEVL